MVAERCPYCGTSTRDGLTCEDQFWTGQAHEGADPACYAVHQLSVPAYYLQHNRYSREGWLFTHELLARFVAGLTPQAARAAMAQALASGERTFSITRGPKLAGVEDVAWTRTIADVRLDSAAHYCADVQAWAAAVVNDSAALVAATSAEIPPA